LTARASLIRRVMAALDASPSRIPVLLGGCGSGRTTVLQQVRERLGRTSAEHVDVERTATTPERFYRAVVAASPFPVAETAPDDARSAFDATLAFFGRARAAGGGPATFLLDEFLDLRTFESFPGLRRVLRELIDDLATSGNRFVLTSRYAARSFRLLNERSVRFEIIQMPPLTVEETRDMLGPGAATPDDTAFLARAVQALSDGRPVYARIIADELAVVRERGGPGTRDPVSALSALLAPVGALCAQCRFSYEMRLHRARGYGALKAILDILGEEEGLTLTQISQRMRRTPGSTKDYLSWLEDVDLVKAHQKRYSFTDPLLRVWVRLHCRAGIPTEEDIAREVHRYALPRLPQGEPALAVAGGAGPDEERKVWGIIEID
jgi:hypothetical protein